MVHKNILKSKEELFMNNKKLLVGAAFSALLLVGCEKQGGKKSDTVASTEKVEGQCHEVNACKGKGQCGGEGHKCSGQNTCKGKGWLKMTAEECKAKGGNFKKA